MKTLTKEKQRNFKAALKSALVEKDVENAYRKVLDEVLITEGCVPESPYQCDGYYTNHMFLSLLLEAKYQQNFLEKRVQCETLTQALFYIKRFEDDGAQLPNVVLVGDINECFIVAGSSLYQYLKEDLKWEIAPSQAAEEHPEFVQRLIDDKGISPFVFKVDEPDFDFNLVFDAIDQLVLMGNTEKVELSEHNIRRIFDSFIRGLFAGRSTEENLTATKLVSLFVQAITGDEECYPHPNRPNYIHLKDGSNVLVNGPAFYAFFSRFEKVTKPEKISRLTEIADRLIEDLDRRWSGDFWTPSIWAERAIDKLDEVLGQGWRDRYIVWDASCGTCNLTRDWIFPNLYLSTLHQSELDISTQYNTNAKGRFQFDFLNDDIDITPLLDPRFLDKMPQNLFEDLKARKPILFLMNPPYAQANNAGAKGTSKAGVALTAVNRRMNKDKIGKCAQQLYAQFFWRIFMLKEQFLLNDVVIAMFTKPTFLTSDDSFAGLRKRLTDEFEYGGGFLFNAGEFADVKSNWGVSFTIFKSWQSNKYRQDRYPMTVEQVEFDKETGYNKIVPIGEKTFWPCPLDIQASKWIREPIRKLPTSKKRWPFLSSGFKASSANNKPRATMVENSFAYNVSISNDVYKSGRDTFMLSAPAYQGNGVPVCSDNFERIVSNWVARLLCIKNWVTDKDQFHIPSIEHPLYEEWLLNSVVYSIFNNQNHCTALRNFEYKSKLYDVANNWFFMSIEDMQAIANSSSEREVYFDAQNKENAFVYSWIKEHEGSFSNEAQFVLNSAKLVIEKTMKYRAEYAQEHPEYHIQTWDAGWAQIKKLEQYDKEIFNRFKDGYKELEARLKPMVYELGFLPEPLDV